MALLYRAAQKPRMTRRPRRRGAVLVEALVVIPVFIIAFTGAIFLGNLYRQKLVTMQTARQAAWANAMAGCSESGDGEDLATESQLDQDDAEGAPGTEVFTSFVSSTSGSASATVRASGGPSSFNQSFSSSMTVACDEIPVEGGTIISVFEYLWQILGPMAPTIMDPSVSEWVPVQ
jgi:Flp pilus assembly protein TadG